LICLASKLRLVHGDIAIRIAACDAPYVQQTIALSSTRSPGLPDETEPWPVPEPADGDRR
jgi:hypothetical protein